MEKKAANHKAATERQKRLYKKIRREEMCRKVLILLVAIFISACVGFVLGILDERNPIDDSTVTMNDRFEVFKTNSETEYLDFLEAIAENGYTIISINVTTNCNFFGKIVDTYFITYETCVIDFPEFDFEAEPEGPAFEFFNYLFIFYLFFII